MNISNCSLFVKRLKWCGSCFVESEGKGGKGTDNRVRHVIDVLT